MQSFVFCNNGAGPTPESTVATGGCAFVNYEWAFALIRSLIQLEQLLVRSTPRARGTHQVHPNLICRPAFDGHVGICVRQRTVPTQRCSINLVLGYYLGT